MPTAVRELALAAILETLRDGLDDVEVWRNRSARVVTFPAVNLVDGGMAVDSGTLGFARYDMTVSVQGSVSPGSDELMGPAISDLQARVVVALLGNVLLDGNVVDMREGDTVVEVDRGEGRAPVGTFETEFQVEFFTREGDPYSPGP